jgi:Uma2 family endonuclease
MVPTRQNKATAQPTSSPSASVNASVRASVLDDAAFMALPDNGHRYETVKGELIDMGNSGALHGYICSTLMILLGSYVRQAGLGAMFDSSTAFKMANGDKRSPDLSFLAKERLQGMQTLPTDFLQGAPDLVVEVLSPNNTVEEIHRKLTEYFANGARLAWIVHPQESYILVYESAQEPDRLLKSQDRLDGGKVVPGFTLSVTTLFQPLEF